MRAHLAAMKSLLHALALIMLVSCGKSPTEAVFSELEWRENASVAYCKGYKFTGTATQKHSNGKTKGEYPFADGHLHGVVKEYYDNGQQSVETNFEHGKRHGSNRYWSQEGKLTKEQIYDHDKSVSVKQY
jgi:antitoxin component YwqK of YwqJK toxin-antitoxin module